MESPQHLTFVDVVPSGDHLGQGPGEQIGVVVGDQHVVAEARRGPAGDRLTVPRPTRSEAAQPVDQGDGV